MAAIEPARFHVREATREDVPALVKLARELAVYEKEPDAVAPNAAELYERNMFEHEYAKALLACDGPEGSGGEAIGMALCVPTPRRLADCSGTSSMCVARTRSNNFCCCPSAAVWTDSQVDRWSPADSHPVLDVDGQARDIPRGPRGHRVSSKGRHWKGPVRSIGTDRPRKVRVSLRSASLTPKKGLRSATMVGLEVECAVDRLLRIPRRQAAI